MSCTKVEWGLRFWRWFRWVLLAVLAGTFVGGELGWVAPRRPDWMAAGEVYLLVAWPGPCRPPVFEVWRRHIEADPEASRQLEEARTARSTGQGAEALRFSTCSSPRRPWQPAGARCRARVCRSAGATRSKDMAAAFEYSAMAGQTNLAQSRGFLSRIRIGRRSPGLLGYGVRLLMGAACLLMNGGVLAQNLRPIFFTPAAPSAGQSIEVAFDTNECELIVDGPNDAEVIRSGSMVDVILDGRVDSDLLFCNLPPRRGRFVIGSLPPGQYAVRIIIREFLPPPVFLYPPSAAGSITVIPAPVPVFGLDGRVLLALPIILAGLAAIRSRSRRHPDSATGG